MGCEGDGGLVAGHESRRRGGEEERRGATRFVFCSEKWRITQSTLLFEGWRVNL